MLTSDTEKLYPSAKTLVKDCIASRIHAKDASLYDFSEEAQCVRRSVHGLDRPGFSMPPFPARRGAGVRRCRHRRRRGDRGAGRPGRLHAGAHDHHEVQQAGLERVSRSRRWTPTRPCACASFWPRSTRRTTLVLMSSKSGGTIEPRLLLARAARRVLRRLARRRRWCRHLVAVTDPWFRPGEAGSGRGLGRRVSRRAVGRRALFGALGLRASTCGTRRHRPGFVHGPCRQGGGAVRRGLRRQPGGGPGRLPVRQLRGGPGQVLVPHAQARPRAGSVDRAAGGRKPGQGRPGGASQHRSGPAAVDPRPRRPQRRDVPDQDRPVGRTDELRDEPGLHRSRHPARQFQDRLGGGAGRAFRHVGIRRGHVRLSDEGVPVRPARRRFRPRPPSSTSCTKASRHATSCRTSSDGVHMGEAEVRLAPCLSRTARICGARSADSSPSVQPRRLLRA